MTLFVKKNDNKEFCSYLAGLIQGDGSIYVAKNKNASMIVIAFHKNFALALIIQKKLGCW